MKEKPDYIGDWLTLDDTRIREMMEHSEAYELLSKLGVGYFKLFIDERIPQNNGVEKIKGRILDNVAEATFEGELGPDFIRFIKKYPKEIIDAEISVDEIPYEGKKMETGKFKGTYHMKKQMPQNPVAFDSQFILIEYIDPSNN